MASYLKVVWHHEDLDEPVVLYSELDGERYEVRKVEVYRDGHRTFVDQTRSVGGSMLGEIPAPSIEEFENSLTEFTASNITAKEFEAEWITAVSEHRSSPM